ncbi:MAG: hypothetical protein IME99_00400 [Proteobacteria bacterium]|nr:hypothetical protein [Pseudomonadota bacterium]
MKQKKTVPSVLSIAKKEADLSKLFRILAFISAMPAMGFFFYIILSAEKWGYSGAGKLGIYLLAIVVLILPLGLHLVSKYLDRNRDD